MPDYKEGMIQPWGLWRGILDLERDFLYFYEEKKSMKSPKISISNTLLWEYDLQSFDFDRSKQVVIERIVRRGNLDDWREMMRYYGKKVVLEAVKKSKQLSPKDRGFAHIFVDSNLAYAA